MESRERAKNRGFRSAAEGCKQIDQKKEVTRISRIRANDQGRGYSTIRAHPQD